MTDMKHTVRIFLLLLLFVSSYGQENLGLLQGGYSIGHGSIQPAGFKINASWEFQPTGDNWTMGGSLGYMRLSGTESGSDFGLTTVPICFVGRMMFGGDSFKFFIRGQGGTHISTISYSGALLSKNDTQWGMALGLSGGLMFFPGEKTFLSAEYEGLWLSNSFANTGTIGTAALGVGFRF